MTTQLFLLSFTFGALLIALHILHSTQIKGALEDNFLPELLKPAKPSPFSGVPLRTVSGVQTFIYLFANTTTCSQMQNEE